MSVFLCGSLRPGRLLRNFQQLVRGKVRGNVIRREICCFQQISSAAVKRDDPFPIDQGKKQGTPMLKVPRFDQQSDPFGVKELVTVKDLFEARVHFGHKAGMWNYRMRPYLYGIRNNIHVFNLNTTLINLHRALTVAGYIAYQRGIILFVNERTQFEILTQRTARQCKEYFVTDWVPGILTNSFKLLGTLRSPDLIIFTSVPRSKTAVKEALTHGVPTMGVADSDCNPNFMLYPIPGNDDTPHAVKLYFDLFSKVISRAKQLRRNEEREMKRAMKEKEKNSGEKQAKRTKLNGDLAVGSVS